MTTPYLKPLPEKAPAFQEFWDAMANHQFTAPKCQNCGHWNWPYYPNCRDCLSPDQVWTPVSGRATLFSYTIVHRAGGAFGADVPYVIVMAELEERPRSMIVLGNLIGVDHDDIRIGMPLRIAYEASPDEDVTLYRFEAA
ncbi:MAG TPA: OB-fold domain-containing protein [Novosphingobium sp.]|nr:OB-fold domain-containing protein [Novosphingobium sp.]